MPDAAKDTVVTAEWLRCWHPSPNRELTTNFMHLMQHDVAAVRQSHLSELVAVVCRHT
jgi:hypothetical protein